MHLHLDPLGGIAGDMFAACLLDARPDLLDELRATLGGLGLEVSLTPASDGALTGRRFALREHGHEHDHGHAHGHGHGHDHSHAAWRSIRARLGDGRLAPAIAARAVAIFERLARAEGRVHGVDPDEVTFHEVGAADSIGDVVAAALLVERIGIETASVGPVPLGSGRIRTAHGIMPVPAPATALLLEGFETVDDGVAGERVTPTGAAILAHLVDPRADRDPSARRRVSASGSGFGTRSLPGISNCLRAILSERTGAAPAEAPRTPHRRLAVIAFEVDDQTGEDLARGIERIRATAGVHDVVQIPAIGKKGRFATRLEVLAAPGAAEAAIEACFRETTTIGLRHALVDARALARTEIRVAGPDGDATRVKLVERPGGRSGKPEADDVARQAGDAASRARLRAAALDAALGAALADAAAMERDA